VRRRRIISATEATLRGVGAERSVEVRKVVLSQLFFAPGMEDRAMSYAKQASKRKRRSKIAKAVPTLGATGLSLALAGGAAAATGGLSGDRAMMRHTTPNQEITLGEEELCDVSLGTFHVFDKENAPASNLVRLAGGCGHGCGGCGRGCGCGGRGCGCGGRVCAGCGCGGWGLLGLGLGLALGLGYSYPYGYGYGYPYPYGYSYPYPYPYGYRYPYGYGY
jgi:hypothetical protein